MVPTLHNFCSLSNTDPQALEKLIKAYEDQGTLSSIINQRSDRKYTPLHTAIFERNLVAVELLLKYGADPNAKCHGAPPLHLSLRAAALPNGLSFGLSCFRKILEQEQTNPFSKDDCGFSVLHAIAVCSLVGALEVLISVTDVSSIINARTKSSGATALHLAAEKNSVEVISGLLNAGANLKLKLPICGSTALHLAAQKGCTSSYFSLKTICQEKDSLHSIISSKDKFGRSAENIWMDPNYSRKTEIFSSDDCSRHLTCSSAEVSTSVAPPENVKRLHVLIHPQFGILHSSTLEKYVNYNNSSSPAAISDVLRVHDWAYVRKVEASCEGIEGEEQIEHLDGDTAISKHSFNAALSAAGCVCSAVDNVLAPQNNTGNAFCAVRPPGHHAGPRGAVRAPGGTLSHGFCLLNNVSIGAAYAMNRYRNIVKKVAIVDFDVHHGNGTEETVRHLKPRLETTSLGSASSDCSSLFFGSIATPVYKPWLGNADADNVLFVSVHGYGPRERGLEHMFPSASFYPGSGATTFPKPFGYPINGAETFPAVEDEAIAISEQSTKIKFEKGDCESDESEDDESYTENYFTMKGNEENNPDPDDDDEENISKLRKMYTSIAPSAVSSRAASPLILDIGVSLPADDNETSETAQGKTLSDFSYRHQWRNYFRHDIFPRLMKFKPDIIFISAGFDAHKKDGINAGYIALVEEDFQWVTEQLVLISNSCCEGRIVSVLEGGYQIGGEFTSAFAKSVMSHVEALSFGSRCSRVFDPIISAEEEKLEVAYMAELRESHEAELAKREEQFRLEQERLQRIQELHDLQQFQKHDEQQFIALVPKNTEDSGRKRRRGAVDYAALDEVLRMEKD